jgi:hypothetical protein
MSLAAVAERHHLRLAAGAGNKHREPVILAVGKRWYPAAAEALNDERYGVRVPDNQHRLVIA